MTVNKSIIADLSNANLSNANLLEANLSGANLSVNITVTAFNQHM
jgi:uncharacterized protein YjbI with pentapeptide repeats